MIRIYGKRQSRAARCMWTLEELGLAYEQIPLDTQSGETRTPDYLALNPSGTVPVLDDDGYVLRESAAICFYLASKAETPLWPDDIRIRGLIHQWVSWSVTELETPLSVVFVERRRAAGAALDPGLMESLMAAARKALDVLEGRLSASRYVAGDEFTLGDVIACSTVMLVPMFFELAPYPAIVEWMSRCAARPAWTRVAARP